MNRNDLDNYITGHYGEDQMHEEAEPEFYGPWRVANHKRPVTISDIITVVWDDNGNPMCYAEDDYFLKTAVERINAYEGLKVQIAELADALDRFMTECNTTPGPNTLAQARAALAKARGEYNHPARPG